MPENAAEIEERKPLSGSDRLRAYGATLVAMTIVVHIVASVATVVLYFLFSSSSGVPLYPIWYAPVLGAFGTYVIFLIIAVFTHSSIATVEAADKRSYGLLKTRLCQLKARLDSIEKYTRRMLPKEAISDDSKGHAKQLHLKEVLSDRIKKVFQLLLEWVIPDDSKKQGEQNSSKEVNSESCEEYSEQILFKMEYRQIAFEEARACYKYVNHYLQEHRAGMEWVTGMGYINVWGALHRAQEALIKVEPPEMVLRGAMHDKLAIQNSTISNRDELIEKLVQAVSDIEPVGTVYFKEHQLDQHSEVIGQIVAAINKLSTTKPKIAWHINENNKDQDKHVAAVHASARVAVSEVRRTLNDFRDGLREGLVRERNQLFTAMSVTALVTHILLCVTILTGKPNTLILLGATAFYMVGAVAGLFGRFYNEANKSSSIDDYGLSQARLLATPLLSGLAGVGGVLITIILYTTLLMPAINNSASSNASTNASKIVDTTQTVQITMDYIFHPDEPSYLLTAAVFGLAPNLIISSLQQRTQKYTSDLQKSKSSGKDEQDS
ncbi:MAG TPA: hypothetical protein VGN34_32860 [Ktedonobacteraceae bacterium]